MQKLFTLLLAIFFTTITFAQKSDITIYNDPEYKQYHDQLKILYIEKINSESHKIRTKTHNDYMLKAKYKENKDKVKNIGQLGAWVHHNLSKTDFTSVKEADEAWEKLLKITEFEMATNHAYHDYFEQVVVLPYGPELVAWVHNEVIAEYPKLFGLTKKQADGLKEMLRKQQE